jgi:hypothetical protein
MAVGLLTLVAALSLLRGANAARVCSNATYPWRIGDMRFDGADPSKGDGHATVAASIAPTTAAAGGTLFECVSSWPESWAGWYQGGSNIIWSDCIWTGNGPRSDKTVSFALDWKNRTMYLTHTFDCSNING